MATKFRKGVQDRFWLVSHLEVKPPLGFVLAAF
jgi:hypothetical protein